MSKLPSGYEESVKSLKVAQDTVDAIAREVDKQGDEEESMLRIMEIFKELGGEEGAPGLVTAHRRFIREEDAKVKEANSKSAPRQTIFLFNDLIVIAKAGMW